MRLREILSLLQIYGDKLTPAQGGENTVDQNAAVKFTRLSQYRLAVNALAKIPALDPYTRVVLQQDLLRDSRDEVTVPKGLVQPTLDAINMLANAAQLLKRLLEATVEPESETTLAIELPGTPGFDELRDFVAEVGEFLGAFTGLPVGDEDERVGAIVLDDFDVGSKYLLVRTGSVAVLRLVGSVFRAITYLLDWGRQKAIELKLLGSLAEDTRGAVELNKKLRLRLARELAGGVANSAAPKASPEEINRIAVLLTQGEKLVERRVRLIPSLKAPEEARKEFPPSNVEGEGVLSLPTALTKLLGDGRDLGKPSEEE